MLVAISGRTFNISDANAEFLEKLCNAPKGGFATVHEYKPKTGIVIQPVYNLNFISRFSTLKVYERKIKALLSLSYHNVDVSDHPKIMELELEDRITLFENCKSAMILSMKKTEQGVRDNAHREAHDLFYHTITHGVKVHFKSEDGAEGRKHLVMDENDYPIVDTVMTTFLEVGRKIIKEGSYKTVNSGAKVLMDNAINHAMKKTLQLKTLVFNSENHKTLQIGGEVYDSAALESALEVAE